MSIEELRRDQEAIRETVNKNLIVKNNHVYVKRKGKLKLKISEKFGEELVNKTHLEYGHIGSKHIPNILAPYYSFSNMGKIIQKICD